MEVNRNNLKITEKQCVKTEKRFFHLGEIINEVISSYDEDYIVDEYFIEYCKDEWICKNKKLVQTEVLD